MRFILRNQADRRSPLEHAIRLLAYSMAVAHGDSADATEKRDRAMVAQGAHELAVDEMQRWLDEDPDLSELAARIQLHAHRHTTRPARRDDGHQRREWPVRAGVFSPPGGPDAR